MIDAGNAPTGFSVATVNGQLALLVGNAYGDILTLLYDGHGGFAPDRANLQNAPLAVGTLASTGQQFAVVADQKDDQVSLYYRIPGTNQFGNSHHGRRHQPIAAPGLPAPVQTFSVDGDPNPYLAVANSLSNNVLVYHFDPVAGQFELIASLPGRRRPRVDHRRRHQRRPRPRPARRQQGVQRHLRPDRVHRCETALWTAAPYQRLNSGGSGPLAVAVLNSGGSNGPELLVTNSDGKVVVLAGIGTAGQGSGFFQDTNPQTFDLGAPIVQSLVDNGQLFVVGGDGSVSVLAGDGFSTILNQGVVALGDFDGGLVAAFDNGNVGLLSATGALLASQPTGFLDDTSALEVLQHGSDLEVFATERGSHVPILLSFAFIPITTPGRIWGGETGGGTDQFTSPSCGSEAI